MELYKVQKNEDSNKFYKGIDYDELRVSGSDDSVNVMQVLFSSHRIFKHLISKELLSFCSDGTLKLDLNYC